MEEIKGKVPLKKVLIVINGLRRGGIEIAAINFQSHIDRGKYNCTYFIRYSDNKDEALLSDILESGAEIIEKPSSVNNYFKEYIFFKKFLKKNQFDIVHSHLLFYSGIVMKAAYKSGIKKRIAHSHATKRNSHMGRIKSILQSIYENMMRCWLKKYATDIVACSNEAGRFLYGEKEFNRRGIVLYNGINTENYNFDSQRKKEARERLGISTELTVGHVGSIYWIKNQEFLIKVFLEILKINPDSVLLLIGEICDGGSAQRLADSLEISEKVKFLGVRSDIPDLLSAMDIFIFPSLFEALPIAPIEAQAAKLPCLISDSVTGEIRQNENVEFLSLNESVSTWAEKAISLSKEDRLSVSRDNLIAMYDINKVVKKLEKIYEN